MNKFPGTQTLETVNAVTKPLVPCEKCYPENSPTPSTVTPFSCERQSTKLKTIKKWLIF